MNARSYDLPQRSFRFKHRARSWNITFGPGVQVALAQDLVVAPATPLASLVTSTLSFSSTPATFVSSASSSPGNSSGPSVPSGISSTLVPSAATSTSSSLNSARISSTSFSSAAVQQTLSSPSPSLGYVPTVSTSPTVVGSIPGPVAVVTSNPSTISQPSATAISTASSATSITHSPALYIGILLGTIVLIASTATVIAWWIRIRQRKSRRLKDLQIRVPWARSSTVSSCFFETVHPVEGHLSNNDLEKGENEDAMTLRHGESEKLKLHLELMGDRDVGMPKRTQSYMEESVSPVKRRKLPVLSVPSPPPIPSLRTAGVSSSLTLSPNGPLPESVAYPLPAAGERRSLPLPPSPLYQPETASAANYPYRSQSYSLTDPQGLHPDYRMQPQSAYQQQFPIGFGTPREVVVKPRYLNILNREKKLENVIEESGVPAGRLSNSHSIITGVEIPRSEIEPAVAPSESWTASIRNRMMDAFRFSSSEELHASEQYTHLPFPTPARARRASMRKAGWVQYTGGEIVDGPTGRERPVSSLRNPFDDGSVGLGIDMSQPSPSSTLPSSHPCIPSSQPYLYSACSLRSLPSGYAASVHSYGSAAPLVNKKNLSVRSGASRPVSRASSRYSAISRTGSVMTVLTEKEEAAGRALRERWARGETRRPKRV
ncbi:hypothetical protein E1B28_011426 [Marasmius oreades]|uniref:Uncharacterized protein n=1 Tax=Marasmius oreades TaxID=181124 RepID=A0A9P7RVF5_9AGAR|nr:uncharacterized protein E1B28_011426 [Marasmius oreades]KAG7089773.1 hypothetical protein E1B28_011426 [Marasmius oreades]